MLNRFLCWIGWHAPRYPVDFDGCSEMSVCKHCGDRLLCDSWGGWFSIGKPRP